MSAALIQTIFGWPAMILSLGLALAAIWQKKPALSLISAIVFLAPAWYLGHYSAFLILLPVCILGSAFCIWNSKRVPAFLFLLPVLIMVGLLAVAVLTQ